MNRLAVIHFRPLLTGDALNAGVTNARALGMQVDNTPSAGAVFQTTAGWYGHVGVVLRVNDDGSILVREMNYSYRVNVITESTSFQPTPSATLTIFIKPMFVDTAKSQTPSR